jgi:oligoribonuclease
LVPDTDRIIEIATIVTNSNLEVIAQGPVLAIHQDDATLAKMDEWNQKTHGGSGLIERVRASRISERDAEMQTLAFLSEHVAKNKSPMCGNSICQDRRFLARTMPELEQWFHYRNLDVSTLKELARRWKPAIAKGIEKNGAHKALDDIIESIEELKYYRAHMLRLD